jgi:hypothetical protein
MGRHRNDHCLSSLHHNMEKIIPIRLNILVHQLVNLTNFTRMDEAITIHVLFHQNKLH